MRLLNQKHLDKIRITDEFLDDNLDISIIPFIDKHYNDNPNRDIFKRILTDDFDQESVDYLNDKLGNMNRFRDHRRAEEYGCDLLLGWIVEDAIISLFSKLGYECKVVSKDRKREFLKRPSSKIDIIVTAEGKEFPIELVVDNTGFWQKGKKIHLREQKYEGLIKQEGILLGLDFLNKKFFIDNIKSMRLIRKIDRHFLYGGKPASELSLNDTEFFDLRDLKNHIKEYLEGDKK